mmetsp:Transcript_106092/g.242897  ORF Transcript_106092/g.242897 Transcript_106092/m.242897 type:complete len:297 (+) Transcript_106092:1-891(+)
MDWSVFGREILAAGIGCAVADSALNPLEVTKIKLQLQVVGHPVYQTGMFSCMRQCAVEDGVLRGLYMPGLTATLIRAMTYTAFRVGAYPTVRDRVAPGDPDSLPTKLLSGAATGGMASAVFCPVDMVRIRLQADSGTAGCDGVLRTGLRRGRRPRYSGAWDALRKIGVGGAPDLYRGATVTIIRAAMLSSSQLGSYDATKSGLRGMGWEEGPQQHFMASLISGMIAQTVVQPADTIRSFLMNGRHTLWGVGENVRAEGLLWLYRGYWAGISRQGPIMVLQMPLVEQIRQLLGVKPI